MPDDFLLRPLDTPPAYAAVVDRIRRALALGVLLPGDRLPAERVLAEDLGVSRVTVREALRLLQGEGLLVTKRGSGGTLVSPTLTSWEAYADYDKRIAEVFEVRLAVETMAARLAAERVTARDSDQLAECQRALESSRDVHAFRRADSEFHLTVARISGNGMLREVVEDVRAAVSSRLERYDFSVIYESSIRGHGAIIDAIVKHDPDAAAAAMKAHIEEARAEVMAVLTDSAADHDRME
jgi:GntR family transcriptional regulator, transcriptional repressor for pyruvate dehydrogenase complex